MKDNRVFKIRRKSDGLYATRNHGYGGIHWGKMGTMWRGAGPLKMAFNSSLKKMDWSEVDIVLFELKETATLTLSDILTGKK